jgi:hypothetical protein
VARVFAVGAAQATARGLDATGVRIAAWPERRTAMPHTDNAPPSDPPGTSPPTQAPMSPGDEAPPGTPGSAPNVCPKCGGSGRLDGDVCANCQGTGQVNVGIGGA